MTKKKIVLLSPHPDDECLNALLPLRLKSSFEIHNLAMTLGSNKDRQSTRKQELINACDKLGFINHFANFEEETIDLINQLNPEIIMSPHSDDFHPTHIKVFNFLNNNLKKINTKNIILNEYWFPMKSPNLMIEANKDYIKQIQSALACHVGEMQRAGYDQSFEAWLTDCARRGNEYLQGFGKNQNNFKHANLYTMYHNKNGQLSKINSNLCISIQDDLSQLFSSLTIKR